MDSVTQLLLGAAVGEATLGRKVGHRAMLWGAVCGTLPDLDVLAKFDDAVRHATFHRSALHSLFVLALLAPPVAWLIARLHSHTREHFRTWIVLVYAVFATHVLLDAMTVFGTQIFWPFGKEPVTWGTIFIIDPLFTLPLLIGIVGTLLSSRSDAIARHWNSVGLTLAGAYLTWTLVAKLYVSEVVQIDLARQQIGYDHLVIMPSPFNSVLWRILVTDDKQYRIGYYSLFDKQPRIRYAVQPRNTQLLGGLEDHWPVRRLLWFTKGFYAVRREGADIVIIDLRAGLEPDFEFRYKVGEAGDPRPRPVTSQRLEIQRNWSRLRWLWERIFSPP